MTILSTRYNPTPLGGSYITGPAAPNTEGTYISVPVQSVPTQRGSYVTTSAPAHTTIVGSYTQVG
jgi:hypothetical protein